MIYNLYILGFASDALCHLYTSILTDNNMERGQTVGLIEAMALLRLA